MKRPLVSGIPEYSCTAVGLPTEVLRSYTNVNVIEKEVAEKWPSRRVRVPRRRCMLTRVRGARVAALALSLATRGCGSMASTAGASPHWEKLWAQDGGLAKGSRFDVAGISLPLAADIARRPRATRSGMRALVPGCGRAYDALFLAEHGFESVVALDLSPTACEAAREEIAGSSSSPTIQSRVAVECGDFFELSSGRQFDFIWDCTFLCALDPSVRDRWAHQMHRLLAADGELLTCVFPIGPREGGPPYAMTVELVRSLLEPAGFQATLVQDDLPMEEQHRRPGDPLESVRTRGTALVTWHHKADDAGPSAATLPKRRRTSESAMSLAASTPEPAPFIIDTDCGLDDLATLALAAAAGATPLLVTTTSGLAPHGHGHRLARRMLDHVGLKEVPVVGGAEAPPATTVRDKQDWEESYPDRVAEVTAAMGMQTTFAKSLALTATCKVSAAAHAIIETASAVDGGATILALGALTNVAEAARAHPDAFRRHVRRIIFIGDTDPSRQSYNAALDPTALQRVLGSGVEMVLVGQACYPRPAWVEDLFSRSGMGYAADRGAREDGTTDGGAEGDVPPKALRTLGGLDPYSMCYDPLALLFHLQPDAFTHGEPTPVRVSGDLQTKNNWCFERCAAGEDAHGHALEPSAVSLERYAAFLRACAASR